MTPGLRVFICAPYDDGGNLAGSPIVDANIHAVLDAHMRLRAMGFATYPEILYRSMTDRYSERATVEALQDAKAWIQASDMMLRIRSELTCRDAQVRESHAREFKVPVFYSLQAMLCRLNKG